MTVGEARKKMLNMQEDLKTEVDDDEWGDLFDRLLKYGNRHRFWDSEIRIFYGKELKQELIEKIDKLCDDVKRRCS